VVAGRRANGSCNAYFFGNPSRYRRRF